MNDKSAYEALLSEVCVSLGFCGAVVNGEPLHVDRFIPEHGPVSAEQFVEWVFRAEGMDPNEEAALKHAPSLWRAFARHMGTEIVDASVLK